jgi:MFS family permease
MSAVDAADRAEIKNVQAQASLSLHYEGEAMKGGDDPSAPAREKTLLRRIDGHVMPFLCIVYALSLIDRTNLSSAKVAGMEKDLVLTGSRYSIVALIFFPVYILVEVPFNSVLRHLGTRRLLTAMIFCWGVTAMCCGFVKTYEQLIGLRILLGFFEGGFNVRLPAVPQSELHLKN